MPALLPRRRVEHALPEERCTCTACGTRLVKIGEETSEQLDYQPASLFVTEHVRFTYACQACEGTVVTAERPAAPIEKGRPGPGLLAQVVTAKYADHLPLNRQAEIFARHGVALARQTLCDWVAAAADLLAPLYEDLKATVLTSKVLHTDDTVVPVLDRDRTDTREGRLWVYVGDGRPADLVYDYTADRTRAGPIAFLGDFRGYLQADAYAGYDAVYATGRVVEVACWAHARRYFFDAKASDPARALPALGFIQQLYAVEREVEGGRRRDPAGAAGGAGDAGARRASGSGWTRRPISSCRRVRSARRSATRGRNGRRSRAIARTARSPSTTTSPSARSERSSRAATTGRSVGAMPGATAPRSSTASWRRARRTASIRGPICATCSTGSPPIPTAAALNCFRGSGRPPRPRRRRNAPPAPRR